jgi:hypothetical protein
MVRKARILNEPLDRKVEFAGLMTADDAFEVGFDGFVLADNVDMRRQKKVSRRPGFADTGYIAGGVIHSAYADKKIFIFQEGTELKRFISATDTPVLKSGLTAGGRLSAHRLAGRVYWSNTTENGVIESNGNERVLGVPVPARVVGTEGTGNLGVGRYLYTFTQVEVDGRESGAPDPTVVEVPENSGLSFTFSAGLARRFYITEENGQELYLAAEILAGETSFVYRNRQPRTAITCDRLLMSPIPAWTAIDWYRASLIYAVGDNVEWSNTFDYELRDQATNYLHFGEPVEVIASLRDGFYVGTDSGIYWYTGSNMAELDMTQVADYGSIRGTKTHINGAVVGSGESTERIPLWSTQRGIVMGLPGGALRNLHENKVDFPGGLTGTALYRNADRQNHYITRVLS